VVWNTVPQESVANTTGTTSELVSETSCQRLAFTDARRTPLRLMGTPGSTFSGSSVHVGHVAVEEVVNASLNQTRPWLDNATSIPLWREFHAASNT